MPAWTSRASGDATSTTLKPQRYSYLYIGVKPWKITLDDSYSESDGLPPEEFEAIRRAAGEDE